MTPGGDRSDGPVDPIAVAVVDAMADPVAVVGPDLTLAWINRAAEAHFGWRLEEQRGQLVDGFVHPDDLELAVQSLASVVTKQVGTLIELRLCDRTGEYSWYEVRGRVWRDGPLPGSVILNLRPTTERRRWELAAGDPHGLAMVLDAAPVGLAVVRADGTIGSANRTFARTLHRDIEMMLDRPLVDLVHPDDRAEVSATLARVADTDHTTNVEARLLAQDGEVVPMSLTIADLLADRAVRGFVLATMDITPLVDARTALHHLANFDDLTGLPNRTNLRGRLEGVLNRAPRAACTLLFGDVDGLKPINDTHGHRAGDAALTEIAARLRKVTREEDYVARLSGDEFVMLISTTDEQVIAAIRARIDAVMSDPIHLPDDVTVTMTISTGVAEVTELDLSPDDLLAAADAAMYRMKRQRSGAT